MEEKQREERTSLIIAASLGAGIIMLLVVLGLLARSQMPVEVAATASGDSDIQAATADADSSDEATDSDEAESAATEDDAESEASDEASDESSEAVTPAETDSEDASTEDASTEDEAAADSESADDATDDDAETVADEAQDDAQAVASVDLTHAELTSAFAAGGCTSCHLIPDITGAIGQLGPDLSTIGSVAATRVEGQSAEEYIRESLHDPEAFVVAECPTGPCTAGIMQAANLDALSDSEVEGMIQYLLSLNNDADNAVAAEDETEAEADSTEADAVEEDAAEEVAEEATEQEPVDIETVAAIVTKGTCGACHVIPGIDGAGGMVGPDLSNIGTVADTRIEGYSAEEYLLESIVDPNAFIAPECPAGDCLPGLMLPNLADLLTTEEIDTLVGYLVTLDGE